MARRRQQRLLSLVGVLLLWPVLVASAHAQQGAELTSARTSGNLGTPVPTAPRGGADYKASLDVRPQPPRSFLDRLPPAEREAFQRNLRLWREFSPEERDAIRDQAEQRRVRRRIEAERMLMESGLQLDLDRREVFILRYQQERRRLERDLRQRMEVERTRRLPEIGALLKREFSEPLPGPAQNRGPQVPFMR